MRDINFFKSYQKNKSRNSTSLKRYGAIGLGLFFILVSISGFNFYRIYQIQKNISHMQQEMNLPENLAKSNQYLKESEKLAILTEYYDTVQKINLNIEANNHIKTQTLDQLLKTMPEEIMLQSMSLDEESMVFQGLSRSYAAIAAFEYNLKTSDLCDEVFVSSITQVGEGLVNRGSEYYTFAVSCKVKRGEQ